MVGRPVPCGCYEPASSAEADISFLGGHTFMPQKAEVMKLRTTAVP